MATVKQQTTNITVDYRTTNEYTRMADLSFKKLIGKQYSDPTKSYYEEQSITPFKLNSTDVWVDDIPSDPLVALKTYNLDDHPIVEGVIKRTEGAEQVEYAEGAVYKLTKIESTKSPYAWYIYEDDSVKDDDGNITSPRLTGFVSDLYGVGYTAKLYINGTEVPTGKFGWLFDYVTGTLTLTEELKTSANAALSNTDSVTIKAYRYIGRTVKEAIGETYDEDLGNLIIQPNKTINLARDLGTTL